MAKTGIEWTDATWNPIRGCSRVSEGCRNCYAESVANRFSGPGQPYEGLIQIGADGKGNGKWNGQIRFVEEHLLDPLKWGPIVEHVRGCVSSPRGGKRGERCDCPRRSRRIFVNSMSDLFHENVTDEMRDQIFAVMALCPQHTFQVLTKRPEQMADYMDGRSEQGCEGLRGAMVEGMTQATYAKLHPEDKSDIAMWLAVPWPLPNVQLGVSVENQEVLNKRAWALLKTPAVIRFLSVEPLVGPMDLNSGELICKTWRRGATIGTYLDWVIVGGESGPGARPMHPDWARSLRDQCVAAGVPFFFKQGSSANWPTYKDFSSFPADLQIREFPNAI